ncbi:MAG: glycosyltransferase [Anaerolineae bacterium]
MNILFPYLARWRSANWSRYHQLLSALCRQGHRVTVLEPPPWPGARETNYTDLDVPLPEGMEVEELAVPLWRLRLPAGKLVRKGLAALAARRRVSELMAERQVDVLLLYNVPQVTLAGCARGRCRLVFDVADDLLAMLAAESGRWAGLTVPLARICLQRLVRASDWVTTSAQTLAPELPGRVRYLPNGVDWQAVAEADGSALRARWGQPLVGFVGAFEYAVDLGLILEAAARLPDVGFLLVGSGRRLPWLESQVHARGLANVLLAGPVPYPRNLDYVQALDIGLLPRVPGPVADHAAPLKLLEYMALGKPVIATPMKETRAIAGEFLWEACNGSEAAVCIERILAAPEAARARAAAARERVQERFDWDRIAADFAALVGSTM